MFALKLNTVPYSYYIHIHIQKYMHSSRVGKDLNTNENKSYLKQYFCATLRLKLLIKLINNNNNHLQIIITM